MPLFGPNIAKLQAAGDVDGLIKAIDHNRPDVRIGAVRALGEIGDPRALRPIVLVLSIDRTYDTDTREAAKEAVRRFGTVEALVDILLRGAQDERRGAAVALAVLGDRRAVDPLLSVLNDPAQPEALREVVAYVLGEIPDPRSVDGLVALLNKETGLAASQSLGKIGDPRATEPLVAFLIDRLREVSRTGAEKGFRPTREILDLLIKDTFPELVDAIGALGAPARDRLRSSLTGEADEYVRLGIESALRRVDEQAALARGPSVTIWVPDLDAARALFAEGATGVAKALDANDPAHVPFMNAILAADVGLTISHEARTDPERGGINITFTIPVYDAEEGAPAGSAPSADAAPAPAPGSSGAALRLARPDHPAREPLDEVVRIVDRDVELSDADEAGVIHSSSAILDAIPHLDRAAQLAPDDLDVLIAKAAVLQGGMQFKSAEEVLDAILGLDPAHPEARVWKDHWSSWASALRFPSWAEDRATLHPLMAKVVGAGRRVQIVRDGIQKTLAVVLVTDRPPPPPGTRPDVRWVLSRTPAGPLVAFYTDIIEPGGEPGPSEAFLPIFEPTLFHPAEGYFLMQLLAYAPHCYVVVVSTAGGVVFNRRLVFDATSVGTLREIAGELRSMTSYLPQERFQEATQWHMDHFDMDRMTFT